jgi:hypothetical protein
MKAPFGDEATSERNRLRDEAGGSVTGHFGTRFLYGNWLRPALGRARPCQGTGASIWGNPWLPYDCHLLRQ